MTSGRRRPKRVEEPTKMQERANAIVLAALKDDEFMKGVLEASQSEAAGELGEPWPEVNVRLGLV